MQPASDSKPLRFTLRRLFALVTAAAVFFAGIFYFISFRRYEENLGCESNLRQIGLALFSYEGVHGCFPPPYVTDAQGNPLYSWRVLILPWFEEQDLYEQWRMDEPWNSPYNSSLPVPSGFSCPVAEQSQQTGNSPYTDYLAVVGPGMAWEEGKSLSLADFVDDWRKTIMVVEVRDSQIHWAEPVDFDATSSLKLNQRQGLSIGSHRAGRASVLLGDCSIVHLPSTTTPEEFKAQLTRAGGENEPWREEGRFDNDYPGYWIGDLRWTGESWEGICECADRELPFSIDFDVVDPTDEQKALALVAARKFHWGWSPRETLDAPGEEKIRQEAAEEAIEATNSQSDDTLADEVVQQLADDMTLQSCGITYSADDATAFPYVVYIAPESLPNRSIHVRFSTKPPTHGKWGEVLVIDAIDEVKVIDE